MLMTANNMFLNYVALVSAAVLFHSASSSNSFNPFLEKYKDDASNQSFFMEKLTKLSSLNAIKSHDSITKHRRNEEDNQCCDFDEFCVQCVVNIPVEQNLSCDEFVSIVNAESSHPCDEYFSDRNEEELCETFNCYIDQVDDGQCQTETQKCFLDTSCSECASDVEDQAMTGALSTEFFLDCPAFLDRLESNKCSFGEDNFQEEFCSWFECLTLEAKSEECAGELVECISDQPCDGCFQEIQISLMEGGVELPDEPFEGCCEFLDFLGTQEGFSSCESLSGVSRDKFCKFGSCRVEAPLFGSKECKKKPPKSVKRKRKPINFGSLFNSSPQTRPIGKDEKRKGIKLDQLFP